MNLSLVRVVHFINRLPEKAVKLLKENGFHTVMGGQHVDWGTYNSLYYFDLTYIEFIAVEHIDIAHSAMENGLVAQLL